MNESRAPIVVGVDETPAAQTALRFALHEASRRGSALDVVTAWRWQPTTQDPSPQDSREVARAEAQGIQDRAVALALEGMDGSPVLSRQVVEGDPADVLLRVSRAADYLVVGSGRKGPVKRMLLGSVSADCVRKAICPVLVVPAPLAQDRHGDLVMSAQE